MVYILVFCIRGGGRGDMPGGHVRVIGRLSLRGQGNVNQIEEWYM